jgi:hypothetical protein
MYLPKYFKIQELVSPDVYAARGQLAWEMLDTNMLITLDQLHEHYGVMTINNWLWGGSRHWSGLRTPECPEGAKYSQHRYGRAADILFKTVTAEQVRQDIISGKFPLITSIETGTSWLHFDTRNCEVLKQYAYQ